MHVEQRNRSLLLALALAVVVSSRKRRWGMTSVSITFNNSNERPIYLQVDPWANSYLLRKGEQIEIVAESETDSPSFRLQEYDKETRILQIESSSDYYIVENGQRVHWRDYPSKLD
jgi:hypothetical protein